MKRFLDCVVGLTLITAIAGCGKDGDPQNPLAGVCGFVCPGDKIDGEVLAGIEGGNASISGIPSIDAFFSAVLSFESAANGVSDGIQAQLDAIRTDFGITGDLVAGLKTKLDANLESKLDVDYRPAECAVDAKASLEASAKCDASVSGGSAKVECKGSCEADVSADVQCDASADLRCTVTAPDVECKGECRGSCSVKLDAAAKCEGTCNGSCSGDCSAYVKNEKGELVCNGSCSGMCTGSCEAQLEAEASCSGTCRGECTVTKPSGGCEGGVRAECRAKANASISCEGRCKGEFEPPMVSAECQASAKAQASVNVDCTPPRLAVRYGLKASADAKFRAALTTLVDVRLPALLQATSKGNLVARAGDDLGAAASGAVKGAIDAARGKVTLKTLNGVICAGEQLKPAADIVSDAAETLTGKLSTSQQLVAAIGLST